MPQTLSLLINDPIVYLHINGIILYRTIIFQVQLNYYHRDQRTMKRSLIEAILRFSVTFSGVLNRRRSACDPKILTLVIG
jgi:hypothetical protein